MRTVPKTLIFEQDRWFGNILCRLWAEDLKLFSVHKLSRKYFFCSMLWIFLHSRMLCQMELEDIYWCRNILPIAANHLREFYWTNKDYTKVHVLNPFHISLELCVTVSALTTMALTIIHSLIETTSITEKFLSGLHEPPPVICCASDCLTVWINVQNAADNIVFSFFHTATWSRAGQLALRATPASPAPLHAWELTIAHWKKEDSVAFNIWNSIFNVAQELRRQHQWTIAHLLDLWLERPDKGQRWSILSPHTAFGRIWTPPFQQM